MKSQELSQLTDFVVFASVGDRFASLSEPERSSVLSEILPVVQAKFSSAPIPVVSGELVAVAPGRERTAALFFDKTWLLPAAHPEAPSSVIAYGGSLREALFLVVGGFMAMEPTSEHALTREQILSGARGKTTLLKEFEGCTNEHQVLARLAENLLVGSDASAIPIFSSKQSLQKAYSAGSAESLLLTIGDAHLVSEEALTWEQVVEIRSDSDAKRKLRRMMRWMDSDFDGRPVSEVADELIRRIEDYRWALRKHGVATLTGSLSTLLDPKFIGASAIGGIATTALAGDFAGVLAAAGGAVAKVSLEVSTRLIELHDAKRTKGADIAFALDLDALPKQRAA